MNEIWMFTVVALLIVMVPGVDSLLVLKNTITYGKGAGMFTMIGIIVALIVWTTLAVLGLATVISKSIVVFMFIKYAGAAYLVYLGIQSWRAKAQNVKLVEQSEAAKGRFKSNRLNCFTQGVTTDLLNPKTLLLYVTLMPQFINPVELVSVQLITLAAILMLISVIWLTAIVAIINLIRNWFLQEKVQQLFNKLTAVILIGLGIKIATEKL